jgi:aspartyl-tRNA(Asn)/glutamyl-tRNA(Gln) amidotransferase subunit B
MTSNYDLTVGIECHVQLNTKSKLFAAVGNDARQAKPNSLVSAICFGLPGVLPVLNNEVVNLSIKAGAALNAEIATFSKFDRKHYFYPDLPKGYQITQYDQPIIKEGYVEFEVGDEMIRVGIERAHLEEDAGKLTHPVGADYSLVDLNRAGTPLLEIVSKPEIHSAQAAKQYAKELYLLMKYVQVSDVDLYHGHMRFDVNVSVSKLGASQLGTRTEVKNLNSFRSVEKSVKYEYDRQVNLLNKGEQVIQETRGWDDTKQVTFSQRGKEEAHDYRYFPEPDIPPIVLTARRIKAVRESLAKLPQYYRQKLAQFSIAPKEIKVLVESSDVQNQPLARYVAEVADRNPESVQFFIQWLLNNYLAIEDNVKPLVPSPDQVNQVYKMFKIDKILSSNNAYSLMSNLTPGQNPKEVAIGMGLIQITDTTEIEQIVDKVIRENPEASQDIKNGEMKAIGFLVGCVMKESGGKANPELAAKLIKLKLE